jgi:EKC/KEOPS complex subunit CGI121/TPRKB
LTTKTIHSELVFNLSGTRNVAESFRRFGVTEKSDQVLVCVFDADVALVATATQSVEGTPTPITQLGTHLEVSDLTLIKKYYKIQDLELKSSTLVDAIVSRIATKSCSK